MTTKESGLAVCAIISNKCLYIKGSQDGKDNRKGYVASCAVPTGYW